MTQPNPEALRQGSKKTQPKSGLKITQHNPEALVRGTKHTQHNPEALKRGSKPTQQPTTTEALERGPSFTQHTPETGPPARKKVQMDLPPASTACDIQAESDGDELPAIASESTKKERVANRRNRD
jgi:hypothetical protein